ncbi:MAG: DUF6273 domain-containing protein [Spirochaetaceae bacterium]|nr:DUF6273 domain-containing protein [Spirochaetaceae bacterium]
MGMYPHNQSLEIFGEQVQWPGVGPDGKFTNGSFEDPGIKPSFIPAETINLLLDNLSALISKSGEAPNATSPEQLANIITHLPQALKIMARDAEGRAQVAEPAAPEDIARLKEVIAAVNKTTPLGYALFGGGRNLYNVLGVSTLADLKAALHERCTTGADGDYAGIQIGDYIDGLDLAGGTINVPWNETYKNTRIVVSGFNHFKGGGDTENTQNHILFTFRNIPLTRKMNSTNTNTGGYAASEMRIFLEADFKAAMQAIFGDNLYSVRRMLSTKGGWAWETDAVFLPTEREVWGSAAWGEVDHDSGGSAQYPIYAFSLNQKVKRNAGSRGWWWLASPRAADSASFVSSGHHGISYSYTASAVGGVAPAFCVA